MRTWHAAEHAGTRLEVAIARQHRLVSLAFPAISTGIHGFPADRAARIAVGTVVAEVSAHPGRRDRVIFCCFAEASARHHVEALSEPGLR